jgi:hypothetical protein
LIELLNFYPNRVAALELSLGFSNGLRLQYTGLRTFLMTTNLRSVEQFRQDTLEKLQSKVSMGRILGPFSRLPISNLHISPIGLVPKSDEGWRLITYLFSPEGNSINYFISPQFTRVQYTSLDSILDNIHLHGQNALLAKIDIKSAFRLLKIHPADFDLMGIKFGGSYYIDKCLPMGCSVSCKLFETFSTFLQSVDHYLDDLIFMGSANTGDCAMLMSSCDKLCLELVVPLAKNKTMGPCTLLPFLGYLINTEMLRILIPPEKLDTLRSSLESLMTKKKTTLKELQSV